MHLNSWVWIPEKFKRRNGEISVILTDPVFWLQVQKSCSIHYTKRGYRYDWTYTMHILMEKTGIIGKIWNGFKIWSDIWNVSYIELRTFKSSKLWSSQLWTQFKQLRIDPVEVRTSTGFEPVTSRYRCDALTNWAMKPLTLGAGHLWVLMSPWRMDVKWYMKCFIYWTELNVSYIALKWMFHILNWTEQFNIWNISYITFHFYHWWTNLPHMFESNQTTWNATSGIELVCWWVCKTDIADLQEWLLHRPI